MNKTLKVLLEVSINIVNKLKLTLSSEFCSVEHPVKENCLIDVVYVRVVGKMEKKCGFPKKKKRKKNAGFFHACCFKRKAITSCYSFPLST